MKDEGGRMKGAGVRVRDGLQRTKEPHWINPFRRYLREFRNGSVRFEGGVVGGSADDVARREDHAGLIINQFKRVLVPCTAASFR
jgi:hypothetical protein